MKSKHEKLVGKERKNKLGNFNELLAVIIIAGFNAINQNSTLSKEKKFITDCENFIEKVALVNLDTQTLKICEDRQRIVRTLIRSGALKTHTPEGSLRIDSTQRDTRLIGADYNVGVMYFNTITGKDVHGRPIGGRGIGIHDAGWVAPNGFGKPGSHGCINLPEKVAGKVIGQMPIGTKVVVFSAKTANQLLKPLIETNWMKNNQLKF